MLRYVRNRPGVALDPFGLTDWKQQLCVNEVRIEKDVLPDFAGWTSSMPRDRFILGMLRAKARVKGAEIDLLNNAGEERADIEIGDNVFSDTDEDIVEGIDEKAFKRAASKMLLKTFGDKLIMKRFDAATKGIQAAREQVVSVRVTYRLTDVRFHLLWCEGGKWKACFARFPKDFRIWKTYHFDDGHDFLLQNLGKGEINPLELAISGLVPTTYSSGFYRQLGDAIRGYIGAYETHGSSIFAGRVPQ